MRSIMQRTGAVGRLRGWLGARPIAGFVLLTFGISYLVGGPLLVVGMSLLPAHGALARGYAPRLMVVYGPGLAALMLAGLTGRDGGAGGLLRRLLPSRADWPRVAAIVAVGAVVAGGALCVAGVAPAVVAQTARARAGLLAFHFALQVAVVAVGEELGWRGWLLPRFVETNDRLRASLATGAIWGVWHGPLLLADALSALIFLLFVLGMSLVLTWLWAGAHGRLFPVVIAHATVNAPLFFWEQASAGLRDGDDRLRRAWYVLQAMYTAAGLVLVLARWDWWTTPSARPSGATEARRARVS